MLLRRWVHPVSQIMHSYQFFKSSRHLHPHHPKLVEHKKGGLVLGRWFAFSRGFLGSKIVEEYIALILVNMKGFTLSSFFLGYPVIEGNYKKWWFGNDIFYIFSVPTVVLGMV